MEDGIISPCYKEESPTHCALPFNIALEPFAIGLVNSPKYFKFKKINKSNSFS